LEPGFECCPLLFGSPAPGRFEDHLAAFCGFRPAAGSTRNPCSGAVSRVSDGFESRPQRSTTSACAIRSPGLQSELDRSSRTAWGVMSANQLDQAGETTSMPTSEAAKQSRASYATRTVRSVFTDNALARWIASRLRSSVGTRDAAFSTMARSMGRRSIPPSNRLAPSTAFSSTRRHVRRSSTIERSLLIFGTSALWLSQSARAALSVSSKTNFTSADVSK